MPIPQGLTVSLVSDEEMRAFVEQWVEDSYTENEASIDREFLLLLDFIHENRDVKQTVRASYSGGVIGFYDRDSRELLVLSEDNGNLHPDTKRTFAHEIIHALQDHAFNLNSLYPDKWLRQDSLLARKALVEGDARYFDRKYAYEFLTEEERNLLGTSYRSGGSRDSTYFHSWLGYFPYGSGSSFVSYVDAYLGLEDLNKAYSNLPTSTEQILHPEKYRSGEAPIRVNLPDVIKLLGTGWEVMDSGVIGELILSMHLHTYLEFRGDRPSAAGWGGDGYALWKNTGSGETTLVSLSAWDSIAYAQSFFQKYVEAAENSSDWQLTDTGESLRRWTGKGRIVRLEINADRVLLIIGNSPSTIDTLSQAVRP